jgi:hypothetical protein
VYLGPGVVLGHGHIPVEAVGAYVPGGRLFRSVEGGQGRLDRRVAADDVEGPVDRVAQEEAIVEDDGDVRAGDAAAVEAGAELDPAGR